MRITFMNLLIVLLIAAVGEAVAQGVYTHENSRYEYAMIALEGPVFVGSPRVHIYYGKGEVEEFRQANALSGAGSTIREQDMTVSAINYLAEQGYELVSALQNDRDADENIYHRYLLRRKK